MAENSSAEQSWLPVIGRALAYICLHNAGIENKTIADKAAFLEGLGLDRNDVAKMLGTSHASISELLRVAKNKSKKGGPKKNVSRKKDR
jgi:hypothetical protein